MANQFFEVGGLRIDLSKVASFAYATTATGKSKLRIVAEGDGFIGIDIPDSQIEPFLAAIKAYRESLKPKYQFKDGWYICNLGSGIQPSFNLRYIKADTAWSAGGIPQMAANRYWSVQWVDSQPPPPSILED